MEHASRNQRPLLADAGGDPRPFDGEPLGEVPLRRIWRDLIKSFFHVKLHFYFGLFIIFFCTHKNSRTFSLRKDMYLILGLRYFVFRLFMLKSNFTTAIFFFVVLFRFLFVVGLSVVTLHTLPVSTRTNRESFVSVCTPRSVHVPALVPLARHLVWVFTGRVSLTPTCRTSFDFFGYSLVPYKVGSLVTPNLLNMDYFASFTLSWSLTTTVTFDRDRKTTR